MKKKIVSIQFPVQLADIAHNQEKVKALVAKACQSYQPDIILLPETWNLGFFPENAMELAEDYVASTSAGLLRELAKDYQVNIIGGSIIVKENGLVRNRSLTYDREGNLIRVYDKSHLFSPAKENESFAAGEENEVFTLDGIKAAHMTCYDIRFPELARKLALDGAEILFVSAEWPHPRLHHWQILNQARAIENQMYVVTANGSGTAYDLHFCGHSSIINPWGEPLLEATKDEEILYAAIDVEQVQEIRKKIPVFMDRNEKVY